MNRKVIRRDWALACLLWGALATLPLMVNAGSNISRVNVTVTVLAPPPCTITNKGGQVDVDFGERVGINKVDGTNYRRPMNYQIGCQGASSGNWSLSLSLIGSVTGFDKNALQTNKADLGIRVYQNGEPFVPGSRLAISLNNQPLLEAVPVKRPGATLTAGTFEAWATLQANYQ